METTKHLMKLIERRADDLENVDAFVKSIHTMGLDSALKFAERYAVASVLADHWNTVLFLACKTDYTPQRAITEMREEIVKALLQGRYSNLSSSMFSNAMTNAAERAAVKFIEECDHVLLQYGDDD